MGASEVAWPLGRPGGPFWLPVHRKGTQMPRTKVTLWQGRPAKYPDV